MVEPQVLSFTTGTVDVSGTQVTWTGGTQFSSVWVGQPSGGEITIGNNTYVISAVQSPTSLIIQGNAGVQSNVPYTYALESNVANPEAILMQKVAYTRNRWGASLFYTDKDLTFGGTHITPAQVFQDVEQQYPEEHCSSRSGQGSGTTLIRIRSWRTRTTGVTEPNARVLDIYPQAGGLVRVPDDQHIQQMIPTLVLQFSPVSNNNILLFDGWYRHSGNDAVIQIYQQAP